MDTKKKLLFLIGAMLIIIFIIILLLIFTVKNIENDMSNNIYNQVQNNYIDSKNNIYNNSDEVYYNEIEINQTVKEQEFNMVKFVSNKKEYFTIKQIVANYIELLGNKNNEVINLMAPKYLQEFNITESNINYYIPQKDEHTQDYYIDIENMFENQISDKTKLYFIGGNISIKYLPETYFLNVMIEIDTVNMLYNIYPSEYITKYKLNNLKVGDKISFEEKEITNRNNMNKYVYSNIATEQYLANELFDDFSYKLQMNANSAYKKLSNEYKKNQYNTFEKFNEYLEKNKNIFNSMKINQYKVYSTDNYTDYICTDQYNNYYIFRQQDGIMRYTVFLDTYTTELEEFKEIYENGNENSKILVQIEKITQMINKEDYNSIYNKLNSTFKQNNFKDISKLKEYLKNNMYDINYIKVNNIYQNDDYYICECTLNNLKNTEEVKSMNIIIKLIDYNNFEMSFSFN